MSSGLSVSLSVSPNGDGDQAPQEHEWPGERWYNKIGPVAKVYSGGMKHSVMLYCKYENSVYIKEINTRPLSLGRHTQRESVVYWYSIQ